MNRFSLSSFLPSPLSDEAPRSSDNSLKEKFGGARAEAPPDRLARCDAWGSGHRRRVPPPLLPFVRAAPLGALNQYLRKGDGNARVLDPAHPSTDLAVRPSVWSRKRGGRRRRNEREKHIRRQRRERTDLDSPRFDAAPVAIRDGRDSRDGLESVRTNGCTLHREEPILCTSCELRHPRGGKRRDVPDLLWSYYEYFLNSVGGGVRKIQSALTKSETKEFFFFNILPRARSTIVYHCSRPISILTTG